MGQRVEAKGRMMCGKIILPWERRWRAPDFWPSKSLWRTRGKGWGCFRPYQGLSLVPCCRPYSKSWSSSAQVLFQGVDGSGGKTCENPYTRSTPVRVWSISSIGLGRLSLQKNISMRLVNQSAHLGSRCQRMHCTHGLNRTGYLITVKFCWADNWEALLRAWFSNQDTSYLKRPQSGLLARSETGV